MSALTDLFSAMANKIRTKTGTQTTYTPSEMVSDGIDDVFDAGVESATIPITPSNASPAPMTSGTGYKPTANGYAISSYETLYPSDVNPQTVENAMAKISGMGTLIQNAPLAITPSSSNPVRMYEDTVYRAGGEGYAIYAYDTLIPQMTPTAISSGHIYKADNNGYAIESYNNVTPSNSSPVALTSGDMDKMGGNGYAIESYDSITPSSIPESVSSGDIVKIGGSGVIVDAVPTPTSITPSDSSPAALTADTPVNPTTSGYAIASQTQSVTPSASGAAFNSGIVNMSSGGYAYSQKPSSGYAYLKTASLTVSNKKATITGLTVGKEYYLVLAYGWSNTNFTAELSSISGGSNLTKIESDTEKTATSLSAAIVQSVYTFTATGTSAELTFSSVSTSYSFVCRAFLFESV